MFAILFQPFAWKASGYFGSYPSFTVHTDGKMGPNNAISYYRRAVSDTDMSASEYSDENVCAAVFAGNFSPMSER